MTTQIDVEGQISALSAQAAKLRDQINELRLLEQDAFVDSLIAGSAGANRKHATQVAEREKAEEVLNLIEVRLESHRQAQTKVQDVQTSAQWAKLRAELPARVKEQERLNQDVAATCVAMLSAIRAAQQHGQPLGNDYAWLTSHASRHGDAKHGIKPPMTSVAQIPVGRDLPLSSALRNLCGGSGHASFGGNLKTILSLIGEVK